MSDAGCHIYGHLIELSSNPTTFLWEAMKERRPVCWLILPLMQQTIEQGFSNFGSRPTSGSWKPPTWVASTLFQMTNTTLQFSQPSYLRQLFQHPRSTRSISSERWYAEVSWSPLQPMWAHTCTILIPCIRPIYNRHAHNVFSTLAIPFASVAA